MSSIGNIPILPTGLDNRKAPHEGQPRGSSRGGTGSGGELLDAVIVDESDAIAPPSETRKGGLPWGMLDPGWTSEERALVVDMLDRVKHAFQSNHLDHSFVNGYEVAIETGDAKPVVLPTYRMDQGKLAAGRELIKEFLIMKIIEPSRSAWRSPLLLIRKPDGSYRMTTDLRGLNSVTKKDQFPLPRIDDTLESMKGAKFMTKLDLKNAFFQILLRPEDREKTAFVYDQALYQYRALPQGLVHSPANLCRIMHDILRDHREYCFPYMDDVAVIGKTFAEVVARSEVVFKALGDAGMKISGKKTDIGVKEMIFLGHKITSEGIEPDPSKVTSIQQWPRPKTVTQLRQFLGLTNYLRKFIQDYATLANGLTRQTGGERKQAIIWDESALKSFAALKDALMSAHVLVHPDFSANAGIFKLRVDASAVGEGGVLYQEQNGVDRVIGYASRTFSVAERNSYTNPERESHAIMWGITHVWKHILIDRDFEVYSDHKPCLALKGLTKLTNARMQRWAATLATFRYKAIYEKGEKMQDCDALSRAPYIDYDRITKRHPHDSISTTLEVEALQGQISTPGTIEEVIMAIGSKVKDIQSPARKVRCNELSPTSTITPELVKEEQFADSLLHDIICLHNDKKEDMFKQNRHWINKIERIVKFQIEIEDGMVFNSKGPIGRRLWVPQSLQGLIIHDNHDVPMAGHLGSNKTLQRIQMKYFWRGMQRDVEGWIRSCEKCGLHNPLPQNKPRSAQYTGPTDIKAFERISMDVMGPFPVTEEGNQYLFTITDLATRWCEVYPIPNQTSLTLAKVFVQNICARFGPPRTILTDRGSPFLSDLIRAIYKRLQVQHHIASAYHPQTNGVAERAHAVFQKSLAKFVDFQHNDWDELIPYVLHAYLTTPHAITGFSPYYLVHGQECSTFLELALTPHDNKPLKTLEWTQFREEMLARMETARRAANTRSFEAQKKLVDDARPLREFRAGDRVRIKNHVKSVHQGRVYKWRPLFLGPYVVVARRGPTEYIVAHEENSEDIRYYNVDDIKPYREYALRSHLFSNLCPAKYSPISTPEFHSTEHEVVRVHDHKEVGGENHYLVEFEGLDSSLRQWLPESFTQCPELIQQYMNRKEGPDPAPISKQNILDFVQPRQWTGPRSQVPTPVAIPKAPEPAIPVPRKDGLGTLKPRGWKPSTPAVVDAIGVPMGNWKGVNEIRIRKMMARYEQRANHSD